MLENIDKYKRKSKSTWIFTYKLFSLNLENTNSVKNNQINLYYNHRPLMFYWRN